MIERCCTTGVIYKWRKILLVSCHCKSNYHYIGDWTMFGSTTKVNVVDAKAEVTLQILCKRKRQCKYMRKCKHMHWQWKNKNIYAKLCSRASQREEKLCFSNGGEEEKQNVCSTGEEEIICRWTLNNLGSQSKNIMHQA